MPNDRLLSRKYIIAFVFGVSHLSGVRCDMYLKILKSHRKKNWCCDDGDYNDLNWSCYKKQDGQTSEWHHNVVIFSTLPVNFVNIT